MSDLAQQRCFNHASREAVALCTKCKRYYCRECITEHDNRLICATCLRLPDQTAQHRQHSMQAAALALKCAASVIVLWLVFYALGYTLLRIPSSFHEGTLWSETAW